MKRNLIFGVDFETGPVDVLPVGLLTINANK